MENELLSLDVEEIFVYQGSIQFKEFESVKNQALALADEIRTVEVNEETLKTSRKLLAEINKSVKVLDDKRIAIKKLVNEPYQTFEAQVKEIIAIVKEADEIVREQVRNYDEDQRQQKEALLKDKFERRIIHYSFRDLFHFHDFLKAKHLNKSASIESIENEMIEFLNRISRDLKAIEMMPNPEAVLSHYTEVKDVALAITLNEQQEARKRQIEASKVIKKEKEQNIIQYLVSVPVETEKELKFLSMLLEQNNFTYGIDYITVGGI